MSEKAKMITLYVENKGRGKALIMDSKISVQEFPATSREGRKSIGINAIKVEMPETNLKAFVGMVKVHHPHQLNILSAEDYEKIKSEVAKPSSKPPKNGNMTKVPTEKEIYEVAMSGGDNEIMAYLEAYPEGQHVEEMNDRSAYLDAKAKNTKKALKQYLADYSMGIYANEAKTLLGI